ncbi:MAG: UDP-N-acetylglucosamine 2-epimerase (non-hydrolyzing) [Bacteroidota bacterium]
MKVFTVVGARPQFVKAAAVSRALMAQPGMEEVLVHTGQHFDHGMSDIFFEEMEIPRPKYNLDIHSLGHGAMTGRMLEHLEAKLQVEQPDVVLVYGDTNSTLAGALAAKKLHIPVAHVEAGLRSFNDRMPEEVNRILTDRISNTLFCPTDAAVENLRKEGFDHLPAEVLKVGDVMQDAAYFYAERSAERSTVMDAIGGGDFALCTVHRAENTDDPERMRGIFQALEQIHRQVPVVLPIHPRTRNILNKMGLETPIKLIDPVGYFDMIELLKHCRLVLTDSGGLQKEAYFFHRPCITMRDQTEWVELVTSGTNQLVGADTAGIVEAFEKAVSTEADFSRDLYGAGNASVRIAAHLNAR